MTQDLRTISVKTIDGQTSPLGDHLGKATLIVNVASKCGFTPQYKGLEALYRQFKDQGLVVLGFPCDQFGHQEPGDEAEIRNFCSLSYDVTFPMYSKISVKGSDAAPLYQFLQEKGGAVKWNFTKFLVDANGNVVKKFDSGVAPESPELIGEIEKALKK